MLKGFLLSYIKYGDQDAIIHCYTLEQGYKSFFVRGIYSSKNKKKPYLQPLNEINLKIKTKSSSEILEVTSLDAIKVPEYDNFKSTSIIFFISEFLNIILREELEHESIYLEIKNLIINIENRNFSSHFVFMIRMLKILGIAPLINDSEYLDAEKGQFSDQCVNKLNDLFISEIWKNIITKQNPYHIKIQNSLSSNLLDSILFYYSCHFSGFKKPKSLEIIRQML